MFYSKNKRLYDLILDKLNENTQLLPNGNPVVFSGNFMFEFNQQLASANSKNFSIVSRSSDSLDFTTTDIVPLVDVQSIQIPFVEKNKRDDWEREFYVAIEIPQTTNAVTGEMIIEFTESNPRYQAVLETLETLASTLTFTEDDYKYTFKVKEPTKVAVMVYNGKYYQLLALTFNLTSLEEGFFGNETELYFGESDDTSFGETAPYQLDVIEFSEIVSKVTRQNSNINDTEETYSVDKRLYEANVTINFNGNLADILLYKEKALFADMRNEYQVKITNKNLNTLLTAKATEEAGTPTTVNLDYTIDCIVSNINITYKNNVVDQLTFKLERV